MDFKYYFPLPSLFIKCGVYTHYYSSLNFFHLKIWSSFYNLSVIQRTSFSFFFYPWLRIHCVIYLTKPPVRDIWFVSSKWGCSEFLYTYIILKVHKRNCKAISQKVALLGQRACTFIILRANYLSAFIRVIPNDTLITNTSFSTIKVFWCLVQLHQNMPWSRNQETR